MLTQCPACHTTFRITGAILRAAHGQVRCGQCNTQFDAIEHLSEETPPQELAPSIDGDDEAPAPGAADIEVEEPLGEEITLEGRRIEISGVYPALDGENSEAHPPPQTIVQEFAADELQEIDEANDPPTDEVAELPPSETAAEFDALEMEMESGDLEEAAVIRAAEPPPIEEVRHERAVAEHTPLHDDDFAIDELAPVSQRSGALLWTFISLVLLLALAAQTVHHFRQDLSRRADVGPYLSRIYAALNLPLEPRWNLSAYAVKQWGVVADPNASGSGAGTLRLRASIANHADFAQPYPLLRLSLEDRFGAEVGSREFKPEEYLTSETQAKRLLDAGESVNADIAIVDPGEEAVGFHLNVCLQRASGVECTG